MRNGVRSTLVLTLLAAAALPVLAKIRRSIKQNPVLAGLVKTPKEWQWSSAFR
jgi:hypothetical protein